jgi:hypothetical protein
MEHGKRSRSQRGGVGFPFAKHPAARVAWDHSCKNMFDAWHIARHLLHAYTIMRRSHARNGAERGAPVSHKRTTVTGPLSLYHFRWPWGVMCESCDTGCTWARQGKRPCPPLQVFHFCTQLNQETPNICTQQEFRLTSLATDPSFVLGSGAGDRLAK